MPSLPHGTVTFLFTDIEGSTQFWENHSREMQLALARHDALLRQAIEENRGFIVKTTGDGVMAAFHTAPDSLLAALTAQQMFLVEPWPEPVVIRVRMGMHTGTAEFREGDYYGPALNRTARLMAAGYGGQVLLSLTTQELCRDSLPVSASLESLGEHRLKDLNRTETIYQLQHPALPAVFPKLKTLDNPDFPNNLPLQLTSYIGREREMGEVSALLKKTRILTLTGTGGGGKTRLSQQVAADVLENYPDGVYLVELAPLADGTLVPQTVAQVLDMREQVGQTILQTLVDSLKNKRLLLLLDNCEHVLSACAQLAATLLRSCPNVCLLATSWEHLGIAGELTYRVPSLTVPDLKQGATPQSLNLYESVRLFIDRALFHKPDFMVTNQNAPALAQLCHRLDGIPLAIELAAARVRSLSVEEINDRLGSRFRLLTSGDRSALPRQQTLRALVDWSYDILSENEKVLLARLSVFAGGWVLSAAESVCGFAPLEDWEVFDLLTALVDKSLVIVEEKLGSTRYGMLETIRQYADEKSAMAGEVEQLWGRHQDWFMTFAEEAERRLLGPDQVAWLNRVEMEHDNLRQALTFCRGKAYGTLAGLRIAGALAHFWRVRGHAAEGRHYLEELLMGYESLPPMTIQAKALLGVGLLARTQGYVTEARVRYTESLALYRELGDKQGIANALNSLSYLTDNVTAQSLCEESLKISRGTGNKWCSANTLGILGNIARLRQDYIGAQTLWEESLALRKEIGDWRSIAITVRDLADLAKRSGDLWQARILVEESLSIFQKLGDHRGCADSLDRLGELAQLAGDQMRAKALYEESLSIRQKTQDALQIAMSLQKLAEIAGLENDRNRARQLFEEMAKFSMGEGDVHRWNRRAALQGLAHLALAEGNYSEVRTFYAQALVISREMEDQEGVAFHLGILGQMAYELGDYAIAKAEWKKSLATYIDPGNRQSIASRLIGLVQVLLHGDDIEFAFRLKGYFWEPFRLSEAALHWVEFSYHRKRNPMNSTPNYPILTNLRQRIYDSFTRAGDALMNTIDALLTETQAQSLPELSLSPHFLRRWHSLYEAFEDACIDREVLCQAFVQAVPLPQGQRIVLATDASSIARPKAKTARDRTLVYESNLPEGCVPVVAGWQFSTLVLLPDAPSSWTYTLDNTRIKSDQKTATIAAGQLRQTLEHLPKSGDSRPLLVADGYYCCLPFLQQTRDLACDKLVRLAKSRRLYFPAPPVRIKKRGRPRKHGAVFQGKDCVKQPEPDARFAGEQIEVACWKGLHFREEVDLLVTVIRVKRAAATGSKRDPKVSWFLFVGEQLPPLSEIPSLYARRYSIEHAYRVDKQYLLWERVRLRMPEQFERWTDVVACVRNQLVLARWLGCVRQPWERSSGESTPSQVRRGMGQILLRLGTPARLCRPRGKSPGRVSGTLVTRPEHYSVLRKSPKKPKKRRI